MRAGQGRTAQPPVRDQLLRRHGIDLGRALPVAQLADVVVARAAIEVLGRGQPAEEDVARGLHEALTLDDALTGVPVVARAEERLVHRWLGFLDLQEEGIAVVSPEQERDPSLRAHAADADDLAREVGQLVAVEEDAPVVLQRGAVPRITPRSVAMVWDRLSSSRSSSETISGGFETMRGCPSTMRVSFARASMLSRVRALATTFPARLRIRASTSPATSGRGPRRRPARTRRRCYEPPRTAPSARGTTRRSRACRVRGRVATIRVRAPRPRCSRPVA